MHQKALTYLKDFSDYKEMAFSFAIDFPTEFCAVMAKLAGEEALTEEEAMAKDVLAMAKKGSGKIECIKYVRATTGWGLKEAKDWCDNLAAHHLGLWKTHEGLYATKLNTNGYGWEGK